MDDCTCTGWKESMPQIQRAQALEHIHGGQYTGKFFQYCPWCGRELSVFCDAICEVERLEAENTRLNAIVDECKDLTDEWDKCTSPDMGFCTRELTRVVFDKV